MDWQIWGLKTAYQTIFTRCILEFLNSNCAFVNRCIHVILLPVGPQKSLLIIVEFGTSIFSFFAKVLMSNFHILFLGSLEFKLRFENFPTTDFFSDSAEIPVTIHRY